MDELYEYLKEKLDEMYKNGRGDMVIDMSHAFRLFHLVCYMKQIRSIIVFQEELSDNGGKRK